MKIVDKFSDKVFRKIWDSGDSPLFLSPCLFSLLAWFDGGVLNSSYLKDKMSEQNMSIIGFAGTFDGTAYLAGAHIVGTETVTDYAGTGTPSISAGKIEVTSGTLEWIELDSGQKYIVQSSEASTQTAVYNINDDSDHLTLTSATTPFFTTEMTGSNLLDKGFELDTGVLIPASAVAPSQSALGNTLTNNPGQIKGAPIEMEAADTPEWLAADDSLNIWFEVNEDLKRVTPTDLDGWTLGVVNDQYFYDGDSKLLIYTEAITENCLGKTEEYVGK